LRTQKVFDMMRVYLDRGEGKKIVEQVQAVFNFEIVLKKGDPPAKTFMIDLKNGNGRIDEGRADTADATFTMSDEDFDLMTQGKLNGQTAFMQGKMKMKGNMKKAMAFTPGLFPPPTPENLAKYQRPKL